MSAPIVEFRRVSRYYGSHQVLRSLDLSIFPGERVAIIGPSGSGKTTVLRTLMTLDRIDGGEIFVDGESMWGAHPLCAINRRQKAHLHRLRSKVGMVFQHYNLFPHLTAVGNCIEALITVLGMTRKAATERAMELLAMVGLETKALHYPHQLSGGQQQRVAIARALCMRPKIMLFDEVTSALDPELVGEVLNVVRQLGEQHRLTMLMVTHQMEFAREFASRICFFSDGCVLEQGEPTRVLDYPEQLRTRQFVSAVLAAR